MERVSSGGGGGGTSFRLTRHQRGETHTRTHTKKSRLLTLYGVFFFVPNNFHQQIGRNARGNVLLFALKRTCKGQAGRAELVSARPAPPCVMRRVCACAMSGCYVKSSLDSPPPCWRWTHRPKRKKKLGQIDYFITH